MKIEELTLEQFAEVPFLNAGPGKFYEDKLPVQVARVDKLPEGVAAIIATSDLQGREHFKYQTSGDLRLLGEWIPAFLKDSVLPRLALPEGKIGVLLAGDFYTVPSLDKRGGSGLVTSVWDAFGEQFSWVVGVAGNHDTFAQDPMNPPEFRPPLYFLDRHDLRIDGLAISGISGIVGNPTKPWRKTEVDFVDYINSLRHAQPDIVLMHEGPDIPELGYRGTPRIREAMMSLTEPLVIRGHAHWETAMAELPNGLQVHNVDARVVILKSGS
jgi:3',5'-cyclic-AMP phosphodiesterase